MCIPIKRFADVFLFYYVMQSFELNDYTHCLESLFITADRAVKKISTTDAELVFFNINSIRCSVEVFSWCALKLMSVFDIIANGTLSVLRT